MRKHAIIIDPCCYPKGGHNVDCCLRFSSKLKNLGIETSEFWIAGDKSKFEKRDFKTKSIPKIYPQLLSESFESRTKNILFATFLNLVQKLLGKPLHRAFNYLSKKSLSNLLDSLQPSTEYLFFFPSADYYFCNSLLKLLQGKKYKDYKITVKFRFIGVMENAQINKSDKPNELFRTIRSFSPEKIILSAETSKYAFYLKNLINKDVATEPYPFQKKDLIPSECSPSSQEKFNSSNPLKVLLLGKPRPDKGNLDLPRIANKSLELFGMNIVFSAVSFPKSSRFYKRHFALAQYPNINFEHKILPKHKYETLLKTTDVMLMPYDNLTYWFRGSAVFFDSIEQSNSVIIARSGCAFADDMAKEGAALKYYSIDGLFSILGQILECGPKVKNVWAKNQRSNYINWVSSL